MVVGKPKVCCSGRASRLGAKGEAKSLGVCSAAERSKLFCTSATCANPGCLKVGQP